MSVFYIDKTNRFLNDNAFLNNLSAIKKKHIHSFLLPHSGSTKVLFLAWAGCVWMWP